MSTTMNHAAASALRCFIASTTILLSCVFFAHAAFAEDITGTWSFDTEFGGSHLNYDMTFVQAGSAITGSGSSSGTTWQIVNGTISGSNVSWTEDYDGSSYYADRVGTISGDSMSGTWGNMSQSGSWTATRSSGGGPTPTPTPGDKRPSAIGLFCNRTGVNLETARCTITLADAGPPPRIAPTGVVDLEATDGFFPAKGSCFPQQTQFSPGIMSCTAEFAIPLGFPIGARFPIDATYDGDVNFEGSSTSHSLVQAGCVGDSLNPCSGAVAMSFADVPAIVKNAISMVLECGGSAVSPAKVDARLLNSAIDFGSSCRLSTSMNSNLSEMLSKLGMDQNLAEEIGKQIDAANVDLDPMLKGLRDMLKAAGQDKAIFDEIKVSPGAMQRVLNRYIKQQQEETGQARLGTALAARKPRMVLLGSVEKTVKANGLKKAKIRLNTFGKTLVGALRRAGVGSIDVSIKLRSERNGKVPKGVKKKVSVNQQVNVAL